MEHYIYNGPVTRYGRVIENKWRCGTQAVSEKKALANLQYTYKRLHNLEAFARVELNKAYLEKR